MGRYQLEEFAPCMILLEKQQSGRRENEKGVNVGDTGIKSEEW